MKTVGEAIELARTVAEALDRECFEARRTHHAHGVAARKPARHAFTTVAQVEVLNPKELKKIGKAAVRR